MNLTFRIAIVVVVQTAALLGMIGMKQWTLNTGTPIVLETQPVDPRSLFQGDYARLNYKINTILLDEIGGEREFKKHDRIYVLLKNGDPYWTPVSIHHEPPVTASGEVAIRGEVTGVIEKSWNPGTRQYEEGKRLQIRYGIENYFVPEGEGRALERPGPDQNISIRVAVDRFGGAGIKAVLVNGLPRYTERLF